MKDNEAKDLLFEIFDLIEKSRTIKDLDDIKEAIKKRIHKKFILNDDNYPKMNFEISKDDLEDIHLNSEQSFADIISSNIKTPLEKLFYAVAWKQGDINKYKHIIKGIKESKLEESNQTQALTFYQFGKYLSDRQNQPIIDQHVLRAYIFYNYQGNDSKEVTKILKNEELTSKHIEHIKEYKNWIIKLSKKFPKDSQEDFLFKVDRILMALGKAIKTK